MIERIRSPRRIARDAFVVVMACGMAPGVAYAGSSTSDAELAKTLYQQAASDMAAHHYDRACPKFEAALRLNPDHVRTAISLAVCNEKQGQVATALERFDRARQLAVSQSDEEKIKEVDGLVVDLRKRVAFVRIIVPAEITDSPALTISHRGAIVAPADWGKPIAVEPGTHDLIATASGQTPWTTTVRATRGQTVDVTISPRWKNKDSSNSTSTTASLGRVGWIGIGAGLATVAAGGVFGGLAIAKFNASNDGLCNAKNECPRAGYDLRIEAQQFGNASTGLFIAGGLLAGVGLTFVAVSNRKKTETKTTVGVGPGSIHVRSQW